MSIEEDAVTLTDVAQGPQPASTVADTLRAAYERAALERKPKDLMIPGYGEPASELHVTFEMVDDYEDLRKAILKAVGRRAARPGQRDVQLAVETLKAAALGSYALVGEERHDLGHPLGLDLYAALGSPGSLNGVGPANDNQAIFMLYHQSTTLIMTAYAELDQWIKRGGRDAEDEAVGESLPANPPVS